MYDIPVLYDYKNTYNSMIEPSTVHVANTGLGFYFRKYLLQKAISVFKWSLPETWAENYFLYVLYCRGSLAVVDTDKYGVIPQGCSYRGYNVFYQPTHAIISNPLLMGIIEPQIGTQCSIIKLQPTFTGIYDIISYYADLMALVTETLGTNLLNSKLSYVFGAESKAQAESFKVMFDQVASGEPATFVDKKLFKDDGSPAWFTFAQDLRQNFIAPELLEALRTIEVMFDRDIGIPQVNDDKKERLTSFDIKANNIETFSKCELWLETLKKGIKETNDMFGLNISVDWREGVKYGDAVNIKSL